MASIHIDSPWFRSYSRALFANDPSVRRIYVRAALEVINETLREPGLREEERQAISTAMRELHLMERGRLNIKAS